MTGTEPWRLNPETRQIIDSVALEYDGYVIKMRLFPKGGKDACCNEIDRRQVRKQDKETAK